MCYLGTIVRVVFDPSGRSVTVTDSNASANRFTILAVRGSVIDVRFDHLLLPINTLLHIGEDQRVVVEAWPQLDAHRVRGIALTPTQKENIKNLSADMSQAIYCIRQSAIDEELFDVMAGFNALSPQTQIPKVRVS
jgi:F0F1-type ATP synthase beta subunit